MKNFKIKIAFVILLLSALFIVTMPKSLSVHAAIGESMGILSEMTDEECLDFVMDNGIEIPLEFSGNLSVV